MAGEASVKLSSQRLERHNVPLGNRLVVRTGVRRGGRRCPAPRGGSLRPVLKSSVVTSDLDITCSDSWNAVCPTLSSCRTRQTV